MSLLQELQKSLKEFTLEVTLRALEEDPLGYTYYVFENLDKKSKLFFKFITLVRFPNWDAPNLKLGDTGFVNFKIVEAGKDKWYDANHKVLNEYRGTYFIFLKFLYKQAPVKEQIYKVD